MECVGPCWAVGKVGEHEAHAPRLDAGSTWRGASAHAQIYCCCSPKRQAQQIGPMHTSGQVLMIHMQSSPQGVLLSPKGKQTYAQPGTHPQHLEDQQPLSSAAPSFGPQRVVENPGL